MIRHILLIAFKAGTQADDIAAVRAAFLGIPARVNGVVAVEWGENDSPEGRAEGFTHSVLMTFADEAARQWTAKFNPRSCGGADFVAMYEAALRSRGDGNCRS